MGKNSEKEIGYMKAKVEDLLKNDDEIKETLKILNMKLDKQGNRLTVVEIKSGIIGGMSGFVGGFIGTITKGFF